MKKIGDLRLNCVVQMNLWLFITLGRGDRVSLYCPIWPETLYVDQAGFEFRHLPAPDSLPSAVVKGMHHYTQTMDKNL